MITKSPSTDIYCKDMYFTNSARKSFSYILKIINFKESEKLLIPAYIGYTDREGSGVLDPIQENNIKYEFYSINEEFKIDMDEIQNLISKNNIKALLLIHYFGFLYCDIEKLKEICKINQVLLIEDCAHSLYSKYNQTLLGDFGDFSFYSLHKVLPTETGGMFKINNKKYQFKNSFIEDEHKISIDSLETLASYDAEKANQQIEKNYHTMAKELNKINGIKVLFPELPNGIIPMNLPVYIESMKREDFYFKMLDKDITLIALYYRLIDDIDSLKFQNSFKISNKIINFPVNQDITVEEIFKITKKTKEILEESL